MAGEDLVQLRFKGGAADAEELDAEIATVLEELSNPVSEVTKAATAVGLNAADLAKARITVSKDAKGFGAVALVIVIAAPVAAHIVEKFWDEVIWPRVKNRLGADAVGKRED